MVRRYIQDELTKFDGFEMFFVHTRQGDKFYGILNYNEYKNLYDKYKDQPIKELISFSHGFIFKIDNEYEIEKKYLIHYPNSLGFLGELKKQGFFIENVIHMDQYYLDIDEKREIKYRKENNEYYRIIKIGSGLVREENVEEISERQFSKGKEHRVRNSSIIQKTRFICIKNQIIFEIDIYIEPKSMEDNLIIEIEFNTKEEAINFDINNYINGFEIKDVTTNESFKNKNLSLEG